LNVVFETAYDCLPDELQEAFRTLALFNEGASFDTAAFAATTGLAEAEAGGWLHRLAGRSLLESVGEARWSLHMLLREFAAGLPPVGEEAWRGFAWHFMGVTEEVTHTQNFLALDVDWPHLQATLAYAAGLEDEVGYGLLSDLVFALAEYLSARGLARERARWCRQAAAACAATGDRHGEFAHLSSLGSAYRHLGEARQAIDYHKQALAIAREIGDRRGEGTCLGYLGLAYAALGELWQAIDYYQQALAIAREIRAASTKGSPEWADARHNEGVWLGNLGNAYAALGETRQAIDYHQQALAIAREIGDRRGEGTDLGNLGKAYADVGETRQAIDYYQQALAISRDIGDRGSEGTWLANLGIAYEKLSEPARAREYWTQALSIFEAIEDPNAEEVRGWLKELEA
jgi:tetratricopeptide (TPR) repeat protein